MPPSVSVVMPMYNEEAYVERAVAGARAALEPMGCAGEIVVVDDASTDRTAALADALARSDPRVRVVHNPVNRRLGGALKAGYGAATKDLIFYTDADRPVDRTELHRAVRLLEYQQADLLAGYRFRHVLFADAHPPQAAPDEREVRAVDLLERHSDRSRTAADHPGRAIILNCGTHAP